MTHKKKKKLQTSAKRKGKNKKLQIADVPPRVLELIARNPGWMRAKAVRIVRDAQGRATRLLIRR